MIKRLWGLGQAARWKMWIQISGQWLSEMLVVTILWAGAQWLFSDRVSKILLSLIAIQIVITVVYLLAIKSINKNGWAVAASRDLQDQYLRAYLNDETTADFDVMKVLQQDLRTLKSVTIFFDTIIPTILQLVLTGIVVIIIGSFIDPLSVLIPFAGILLLGMGMGMLQGMGDRTNLRYIKSFNLMGQRFLDDFLGMSTLIMNGRQHQYANDFKKDSENFRQKTMGVLVYQLQSLTIMDFCLYGAIGFFLMAQGHAISTGTLTISQAIGLSAITVIWLIDFRKFGYFMHVFMSTLPKIKRLFTIIDAGKTADIEENPADQDISQISLSGQFGYKEPLVEISDWQLGPGQIIGLTGPSGSGKSTIAKNLMKQLRPIDGQIKVDGTTDLDQISTTDWMRSVAYLGPNTVLFAGTIEENLLQTNTSANWQKILQSLNLCQFVTQLPKGYQTEVGENGSQLSPGQRQQIAVARAILSAKQVYIFDEVTSNIDPENADLILAAIKEIAVYKIVLLITHRLADLQQLSQLYLITDKKLVSGDFTSLQADVPEFKQLVSAQQKLLMEAGLQ
ncbi:ATP-binding cassette domain-containing protein [Companilactobacillus furfuricola]|uniref:ATP-binding cassette domain-containing protein n=1 Tax=Companilactobacillus furfuricola TaxID=1462575 RepID=UPI000F7B0AC8|nr:ATP-binding cassette domain-containing protein [Companilactobacillus furfuricola]